MFNAMVRDSATTPISWTARVRRATSIQTRSNGRGRSATHPGSSKAIFLFHSGEWAVNTRFSNVVNMLTLLTDRGLCYFQPMLKDGHKVAKATFSQIRSAANSLVLECAANPESPQGGIATNIGMEFKASRLRARRTSEWGSVCYGIDL